mmetsp:Transcript_9119/g.12669  ORF Transcript_9119/g.12669 Transcript_9119/m.12669 type:complete len:1055 (-) Transcript_9119:126-3290(-)
MMKVPAFAFTLLLYANRQNGFVQADDAVIFETIGDAYAQGQGEKVGTPCSTGGTVSFVDNTGNAEADYMTITTTKWHSGGYRMSCLDKGAHTGWACWAACQPAPYPNFSGWSYLTFEAKAWGTFDANCQPTIAIVKKWPAYPSNVIALKGSYVDGGSLNEMDWKTVVIPTDDFATDDWPNLDQVKDIYFRSCGTDYSVNPTYQIRGLKLTDVAPAIAAAPITPAPTDAPTSTPTTAQPTGVPSSSPTMSPTDDYWAVWESPDDNHTRENPNKTCFAQKERLNIDSSTDADSTDYFTVQVDPWVGGGLLFGCQQKDSNYNCIESCYGWDGSSPDWSDKGFLTFLAKVEGDFTEMCQPAISLTGGGWPRLGSNKIELNDAYVDQGYLVSDEWRRVMIPMADLKTAEWNLNNVYGLYFNSCGTDHSGAQPKYKISAIAVTNTAIELMTHPPSSSPTEYVTDDLLLATHRFYNRDWYPLVGADREPAGNVWYVAEDDTWPAVPSTSLPHTATVLIPEGQHVVYSQADTVVYDKIVVKGSLTILPASADVTLTVGTILVEEGGVLDILTTADPSSHTVTINIDGALDPNIDPEEQYIGIVVLGGELTIEGNPVEDSMIKLAQTATAGSQTIELETGSSSDLQVGDELILPDTQTGLAVGHWNFPNNEPNGYTDQTESCVVSDVAVSGETVSSVMCQASLLYDHTAGSHAGHVTRSITIKTSPSSADRGHILHTGVGKFHVKNARLEQLGRTTIDMIDSTVMSPNTSLKFGQDGLTQQMLVSHKGTNQIARYALHAHHSLAEGVFDGNAMLYSPRDGCVAHNSRVHIINNVILGADGTGIFLEDATETGPVTNNYIIGTGGGSRGGDDGRFSSQAGKDMAHGGFGIWSRGKLAPIMNNHCEGHFGVAPYSFFVHPLFLDDKVVPHVPGTNPSLAGKTLREISNDLQGGLHLQSYGGFINNTAVATFQIGIDLSYFSSNIDELIGSKIEGAYIRNLALNGRGISTIHSKIFTLVDVTIEGGVVGNTMTGIWCNNCNECELETPFMGNVVIEDVAVVRGGNC